jgi:poly-beta-1,6-N-acetyl-D-glucosamine synthase
MLEVWLSSFLPRAIPAAASVPPAFAEPAPEHEVATLALDYAVVTPARDEAANLPRLAASLAAQTVRPRSWVVVDTGSEDGTADVVRALAAEHPWVQLVLAPDTGALERGAPIVLGFEAGVEALAERPDVVVKVDADISFERDHFERLLAAFAADATLGIASGGAEELEDGVWRPRFNTGDSVWGAARAYRARCLDDVLPLERSMGWDGIDELKAHLRGWTTRTLPDLAFRHHRLEGARDGRPWKAWLARGRTSHYMGYRAWYLLLRTLHHTRREPAALAMLWGYGTASVGGREVCPDPAVRAELRRSQTVRNLRIRRREALGAGRS